MTITPEAEKIINDTYPVLSVEDAGYEPIGNAANKYARQAAHIGYKLATQWILVIQRKPDNRTYVLAYDKYAGHIVVEYKHGCFFDGLNQLNFVIKWLPLPTAE